MLSRIHYIYHQFLFYVYKNNIGFLRSLARTTPYQSLRKKIWVFTGIKVGEDSYINHSITILDGNNSEISIGARVALSPNIVLISHSSPNNSSLKESDYSKKFIKNLSIVIGDDTWIGAGSIIQPGVKIGKRCIIGSMSNVTKDIPDDSLAYGNPATIIRSLVDD